MSLALTKTLQMADLDQLVEEVAVVDAVGLSGQTHEARRWEYAMALRAYACWFSAAKPSSIGWTDVGGAGSPFHKMVMQATEQHEDRILGHRIAKSSRILDPAINEDLASYISSACLQSVVFCLSVLEHVEDLDQFLYHLSCLVAPGGLLFLTMDCWNKEGPDTAHFHWMRKHIFNVDDWIELRRAARDFSLLGNADWAYHGDTLYGSYSIASLALVKRS